jgi:hypothetical protein
MQPNFFLDLAVRGTPSAGAGALTALPVLTRLVSTLHGVMWRSELELALAFPHMREGFHRHPGNVLRVYSTSLDELAQLTQRLRENERLDPHVHCHFPRSVPTAFDGPWVEYRRFRVRSRGSGRATARAGQIVQAESFPFFRLNSKRTAQVFSLHIQRLLNGRQSSDNPFGFKPDSYGLSTSEAPFALPMVEC